VRVASKAIVCVKLVHNQGHLNLGHGATFFQQHALGIVTDRNRLSEPTHQAAAAPPVVRSAAPCHSGRQDRRRRAPALQPRPDAGPAAVTQHRGRRHQPVDRGGLP